MTASLNARFRFHVLTLPVSALAVLLAAAPAAAEQAQPPPPPGEWTPPSDSAKGGEGNLHDAPLFPPTGETRHITITWNPVTLFAMRAQFSLELMLTDHHVLELTGYYAGTRTNEVYPTLPDRTTDTSHEHALTTFFQGGGGEFGYRWFSGKEGPRGFYIGPSFLLGHFTATPARGAGTSAEVQGVAIPFWNYGGAIDLGYQAIIADRLVVGLGGGLQYTVPSHTFPAQELPASVYANRGLRPRFLITLGVAF
jgi:hypothetical protein